MMIDYPQPRHIHQLQALWKTVFQDEDAFIQRFFDLSFSPQRCLCALEGDTVTGMLHWLPCSRGEDRFAYLYAVSVHPDHRGRGIARDLMNAVHTLLAEEGYAGVLLYPQEEELRRMYRNLGYETATAISEHVCSCAPEPVPLHPVTPEEYIRLRREFLPENGVIQEDLFVQLMAGEFRFYKGLGFLLAARMEKDHLYGAELLGNRETMPGILQALGVPFARFRTPGSRIPFAMFRPLTPGCRKPDYFGLPLD